MKGFVIALGAVVLSGCQVGFLGDSITYIAKPQLQWSAGAHGWTSFTDAVPGFTTSQIVVLAQEAMKGSHPDALVINAGSNDVGENVLSWQAAYDKLVALVSATPCVVLTTISAFADVVNQHAGRAGTVTSAQLNDYIRGVVSAHHWQLVDWAAHAMTPGFTTDGLHPSVRGADWLANADAAAVQTCAP